MEIREGYKKTEFGIIPHDWEFLKFSEVLKIRHGKSQHDVYSLFGRYPILATGGVIGYTNSYLYDKPSVLIGRKGTIDVPQYMDTPFWTIDTLFYSEIYNNAIAKYIYYLFHTIDWYKFNEASGVPSLNAKTIESISVPIAPLPEQRAISSALSDIDGLISSIIKLINKKKNIKQGAMQQLLTGKRRLDGFEQKNGNMKTQVGVIPKDWTVKTLGELFEITSSKRVFQSEWRSNGIPFYRARELAVLSEKGKVDNELFISKEMYYDYSSRYGAPKVDDILVTGVGTLGKLYVVKENDKFYFKDGNIIWFKTTVQICSSFIKYLYQTPLLTKQIENSSEGTTVGTYTITNAKNTIIPVPTLNEQTAIARVLSDMDTEIELLQNKLVKYKNIKKGMMQELLTGRIRLIEGVM